MEDGVLVTATLHSHLASNTFNQEIIVIGPSGHLTVRGGDLIGHKMKGEELKEEVLYLDVQDLQLPASVTSLPKPYVKGLYKMVANLASAFQTNDGQLSWGKEPVQTAATFEDGLYVQAVLDAIRKSSDERAWQPVNIASEPLNTQAKYYIQAAKIGARIS